MTCSVSNKKLPIYATEKLATRRCINVSKVVCDTGTSNQSTASRKHIHHTHYCFLPNTTAADIIHTRSKAPTPAPIPTYMPNLLLTPGLAVAAGSVDNSYTASTLVIVTPTELINRFSLFYCVVLFVLLQV